MNNLCSDIMIYIFSYMKNSNYIDVYTIANVCKSWRAISIPLLKYIRNVHLHRAVCDQYVDSYTNYSENLSFISEVPYIFGCDIKIIKKEWVIVECNINYITLFFRYKIYTVNDDENYESKKSMSCTIQWDFKNNTCLICKDPLSDNYILLSNYEVLNILFINPPLTSEEDMKFDNINTIKLNVVRNNVDIYKKLSIWKLDMHTFKLNVEYLLTDNDFTEFDISYKYIIKYISVNIYLIIFTLYVNTSILEFTCVWNEIIRVITLKDILTNTLYEKVYTNYIVSSLIDKFFLIPPQILI
jgi:hypothetical protein